MTKTLKKGTRNPRDLCYSWCNQWNLLRCGLKQVMTMSENNKLQWKCFISCILSQQEDHVTDKSLKFPYCRNFASYIYIVIIWLLKKISSNIPYGKLAFLLDRRFFNNDLHFGSLFNCFLPEPCFRKKE